MGIPMRLEAPAFRRAVWGAAFVLCSTLAVGELHLHSADATHEFCTACSLAHADLATTDLDPGVGEPGWAPATAVPPSRIAVVALPFAAERSRAPPLYF